MAPVRVWLSASRGGAGLESLFLRVVQSEEAHSQGYQHGVGAVAGVQPGPGGRHLLALRAFRDGGRKSRLLESGARGSATISNLSIVRRLMVSACPA